MSTQIEFEQTVVRLTPDEVGCTLGNDYLILLIEGGVSSRIDRDGRIARNWFVMGYGTSDWALQHITERASACDRGELRMEPQSRGVRGHAYTRRWQQRIIEAWTLHQAFAEGFSFSFQLDLNAERIQAAMATEVGLRRLSRLNELRPPITVDDPAVPGQALRRHLFSVSDPEQLAIFNDSESLGLGPWSRKVRTLHHARRFGAFPDREHVAVARVVRPSAHFDSERLHA